MQGKLTKYMKLLLKNNNIIFHGVPGTGKTHIAKEMAKQLSEDEKSRIELVQFHPNYDYTDFVEGIRPVRGSEVGQIGFELKEGVFKQFVNSAKDQNKNFVFIIDEINRGEISKIFGELFSLLESDYRGPKHAIALQYQNFYPEDKQHEKFYIPKNVYIIGTMNDIDRSVDTFDFAMRRRFSFIEITPEDSAKEILKDEVIQGNFNNMNQAIKHHLGSEYQIGASYLKDWNGNNKDLDIIWKYKIEPLLKEYSRGILLHKEFEMDECKKVLLGEKKWDDKNKKFI